MRKTTEELYHYICNGPKYARECSIFVGAQPITVKKMLDVLVQNRQIKRLKIIAHKQYYCKKG